MNRYLYPTFKRPAIIIPGDIWELKSALDEKMGQPMRIEILGRDMESSRGGINGINWRWTIPGSNMIKASMAEYHLRGLYEPLQTP